MLMDFFKFYYQNIFTVCIWAQHIYSAEEHNDIVTVFIGNAEDMSILSKEACQEIEEKSQRLSLSYSIIKYELAYFSWRHLMFGSQLWWISWWKRLCLMLASICSVVIDLMEERVLSRKLLVSGSCDKCFQSERTDRETMPVMSVEVALAMRVSVWEKPQERQRQHAPVGATLLPSLDWQPMIANSLWRLSTTWRWSLFFEWFEYPLICCGVFLKFTPLSRLGIYK